MITVFSCISVLWVGFVWINSMQVGAVSGEMSGSLTNGINEFFSQFIDGFYISGIFVRKLAHFFEFAVLAFLLCIDYYYCFIFGIEGQNSEKKLLWVGLVVPISMVIACIDETIQVFVEGRIGSVTDVFIDGLGALLATLLFIVVFKLKRHNKKRETL